MEAKATATDPAVHIRIPTFIIPVPCRGAFGTCLAVPGGAGAAPAEGNSADAQEIILGDMSKCEPAEGLSESPAKDHWRIIAYETTDPNQVRKAQTAAPTPADIADSLSKRQKPIKSPKFGNEPRRD